MKERHKNVYCQFEQHLKCCQNTLLQPQELNTNVKLRFITAHLTEWVRIYLNTQGAITYPVLKEQHILILASSHDMLVC